MQAPTSATSRHRAVGRGTKNTAGRTTSVNLTAANRVGGMSPSPSSITTKFTPQMTAATTARAAARGGRERTGDAAGITARVWCPPTMNVHLTFVPVIA